MRYFRRDNSFQYNLKKTQISDRRLASSDVYIELLKFESEEAESAIKILVNDDFLIIFSSI